MKRTTRIARRKEQEGSALLVSLMVMVGLSLLGLGFVAISETESAISVNHRNHQQTLQVAESGARAALEWFQSPRWSDPVTGIGLMPTNNAANTAAFKRDRLIDLDGDPAVDTALVNIGKYKIPPGAALSTDTFCCDRPFQPANWDRLWGTEESPDMLISDGSTEGAAFLGTFNGLLFPSLEAGQVTEIRLYAPPIIGGELNASGFYNDDIGSRYGLGTLSVTAEKRHPQTGQVLARRNVKIVFSEWPFPAPGSPIQSDTDLGTTGATVVHWGAATSAQDLFLKRTLTGLPWFDAWERIHFQYGYDSSKPWQANTAYVLGQKVHPTAGAGNFSFQVTTAGTSHATDQPDWATVANLGDTITDGTVVWTKRQTTQYPVVNSDVTNVYDDEYWLHPLLGRTVQDPWVEARAEGAITNSTVTTTAFHPFKYNSIAIDPFATPLAGYSNWFQGQTQNDFPPNRDRKEILFPTIEYTFWKDLAVAGEGTEGVKYLRWVADDQFRDSSGIVRTFRRWTNAFHGADRGFYFFDTRNGQNPQQPGGEAFLTPDIDIASADGNVFTMSGFIYLNAASFGSSGVRGVSNRFNMPGEPYRDIGYFAVDTGTGDFVDCDAATAGVQPCIDTSLIDNGQWDFQDLDDDGFDIFVAARQGVPGTPVMPVLWFPGCTPGTDCSEPHEPYLNLIYPQDACCSGLLPNPFTIGWQATPTRRPKERLPGATAAWPTVDASDICTDATQFEYCTSNGYDRDGYADQWTATTGVTAPILDGVLYVEGDFDAQGNAVYFGSVLINGEVFGNGTLDVWFDERLIKDQWPPEDWPFPRVMVTAIKTDE